jgi:hypothetical protein
VQSDTSEAPPLASGCLALRASIVKCDIHDMRAAAFALSVIAALVLMGVLGALATASRSSTQVVLGSEDFAPNGHGFGTAHPNRIYNGGDVNGLVRKIHWKDWGAAQTFGEGRGYQFKPEGGYYSRTVTVQLRASHIGHCPGHGRTAYTKLKARMQKEPGGEFGRWFRWAGAANICSF